MWHVCGTGKVHTGFWWGDLMENDHLEGEDNIKMYLQEVGCGDIEFIALVLDKDR